MLLISKLAAYPTAVLQTCKHANMGVLYQATNLLNTLQGPFPATWANNTQWASSLVQLDLARGNLTSALPMTWSLNALQHLDLSYNTLTGSFLHIVTPALQYLDVSMNGLTDVWADGPPWTTANLKTLYMNHVRMSGSLPGGKGDEVL